MGAGLSWLALVPRWLLAALLAALLAGMASLAGMQTLRLHAVQGALAKEQAAHADLQAAVEAQKLEAARQLIDLTATRDALQRKLDDAHTAREKIDAQNKFVVAAQQARLDAALRDRGGRLCGPPERGSGGAGAPGGAAAGAGSGAGDAPEATWTLRADAGRLLGRLIGEADEINVAYASCRERLMGGHD